MLKNNVYYIFIRSTCLLQVYIEFELLMQYVIINTADGTNNSNGNVTYIWLYYGYIAQISWIIFYDNSLNIHKL